jgi:cell pole-organizing protein PopZ
MSYSQTQSQRAVNDILSSIRQIISEDAKEETKKPSLSSPFSVNKKDNKQEEILELTRVVETDGSIVDLSQKGLDKVGPVSKSFSREEKDLGKNEIEAHPEKKQVSTSPDNEPFLPPSRDPQEGINSPIRSKIESPEKLLSEEALRQSANAFRDLEKIKQSLKMPDHILDSEKIGNYTVDDLVRELLRPILREWLDAHLPSMIRTLVAEQIEKALQQRNTTPL